MKIGIIKLGADGDVIRTLPLAKAIKTLCPICTLFWITRKEIKTLLERNPHIDKIYCPEEFTSLDLDVVYNLEIDKSSFLILEKIKAKRKYGFYGEDGFPVPFNNSSEYYLNTIFDDGIKKENKRTYQEMIFNIAELPYNYEHETIYLTEEDRKYVSNFIKKNNLAGKNIIGVHIGASPRWPSKIWHIDNLIEFLHLLIEKNYFVLILGGPNETDSIRKIKQQFEGYLNIVYNNPNNTKREFASLIKICDKVVCADSFALHISLALKKPTVALFFCTSPTEIEDYGLLRKVISNSLYEFFPERQDEYNAELTKSIQPAEVMQSLESFDQIRVINAIIKDKHGRFLLIKRANEGIHANKWAFPGGRIESGETKYEAIKREIKEEIGLDLVGIHKKISEYKYPRPDGKTTFGESFLISTKDEQILLNNEVQEFAWVSLEEMTELDLVPGVLEEASLAFI